MIFMYNKDYVSYATKKGDFWEKNSLGWRRRTMMNDETALSLYASSEQAAFSVSLSGRYTVISAFAQWTK